VNPYGKRPHVRHLCRIGINAFFFEKFFVTSENLLRYKNSKAIKSQIKIRTKENNYKEFIMVDNINNSQAAAQAAGTESTQAAKDKYGFDMITSVELMFAKLQNDLAVENREYAKSRIEGIKAKQAEQKEISNAIVALRGLLDGKTKDDDKITVSLDLANRINKWTPEGSSSLISFGEVTKAKADAAIASLQSIQETKGSDIQQDMIFVQDFMSKVASYSQGAISAISKSGDTLTSIARG
jgi:hypothetical protein